MLPWPDRAIDQVSVHAGLGPWWVPPHVLGVLGRPHGKLSGGLSKNRPGWRELNLNESQVGPHLVCWAAPPGFDQ